MTNQIQSGQDNAPREIAPFNPAANGTEHSIDEMAIAVDELNNLVFAASTLVSEFGDNTPETRAISTLLGAMQPHLASLRAHCTQQ